MKKIVTIVLFSMFASLMQAQITIGGNVYGGGNAGDTKGNTRVTVYEGDLNNVYGGARMADVNGNAFVHMEFHILKTLNTLVLSLIDFKMGVNMFFQQAEQK